MRSRRRVNWASRSEGLARGPRSRSSMAEVEIAQAISRVPSCIENWTMPRSCSWPMKRLVVSVMGNSFKRWLSVRLPPRPRRAPSPACGGGLGWGCLHNREPRCGESPHPARGTMLRIARTRRPLPRAGEVKRPRPALVLAAEPHEIVEQRGHQRAVAGVLSWQAGGIEVEQVARLHRGLRPRPRGHRHHAVFAIGLARAQLTDMGLDLGQRAAQIGRLLGGHAAMLVEIDRNVRHKAALASDACASARSTEPIDSISVAPRTPSDGTVIMVAMRR